MEPLPNDVTPAWRRQLREAAEKLLSQKDDQSRLRNHRVLEEEFKVSGFDVHFIDNKTIGK